MVVAKSVEGFDRSLGILAALVADEGETARLSSVLVLGKENARNFTDPAKELLQIRVSGILRQVGYAYRATLVRC